MANKKPNSTLRALNKALKRQLTTLPGDKETVTFDNADGTKITARSLLPVLVRLQGAVPWLNEGFLLNRPKATRLGAISNQKVAFTKILNDKAAYIVGRFQSLANQSHRDRISNVQIWDVRALLIVNWRGTGIKVPCPGQQWNSTVVESWGNWLSKVKSHVDPVTNKGHQPW